MLWVYTEWTKLLFTTWVTFHLFCFAVFHKNLKKLEVLYVVTSLLVPVIIAIIPLVTQSYGLNPSSGVCYIYNNETSVKLIERIALWECPAMFMLLAMSIAMVVIVIKLARQLSRQRSKYESITDDDQFMIALKQILPLAAFPMLFFICEVPVLIVDVYSIEYSTQGLKLFSIVCISLWSMTSGATVIIHICVTRIHGRKRKRSKRQHVQVLDSNQLLAREETVH